MSEQRAGGREMCVRETDEHFYMAVSRPFSPQGSAYRRLSQLATSEHILDEGSQVYVYDRKEFGWADAVSAEEDFVDHVQTLANELGNINLDPELQPVSRQKAQ